MDNNKCTNYSYCESGECKQETGCDYKYQVLRQELSHLKQENEVLIERDNIRLTTLGKENLELKQENETLTFKLKLAQADYEASEQENEKLKEIQKRLQDDLKRTNEMYFKESNKNYKLSEISNEYNARRCIESLIAVLDNDTNSIEDNYKTIEKYIREFIRIHKVMTLKYDEQKTTYRKALEEIKNNCVETLATIAEEGKPGGAIIDTIWCKNIPCCTLFELIENTQNKINEVLK